MTKNPTLLQESLTRSLPKEGRKYWLERLAAILFLVMIVTAMAVLTLRLLAGIGQVWLQESVLWLHAMLFLLGGYLATKDNRHVRIEILHERFSGTWKWRFERLGHLFLTIPMMSIILWSSLGPVARAWQNLEASPSAGGLPGLFMLKTALPLLAIAILIWALLSAIAGNPRR